MKTRVEAAQNWPGFSEVISEVKGDGSNVSQNIRSTLLNCLKEQYSLLGLNLPKNFERLENPNSRTITTGHQLQLFGGPAFLHYKVLTAIRKSKETGAVPVFWLASEDHDFKEISWVWGEKEKHIWETKDTGSAVGMLSTQGLREAFECWSDDLDVAVDDIDETLVSSSGLSYSQFYIKLMHLWYGDKGLVVIDASHKDLKNLFSNHFAKELAGNGLFSLLNSHVPIKPREINLFYSPKGGKRIGIIKEGGKIRSGEIELNTEGAEWEIWARENAELLSPSVLLRPIYQEFLLPNSHVILGPSEMSYWMQIADAFEEFELNAPTLFLRDHVIIVEKDDADLLGELGWSIENGWLTSDDLVRKEIDSYLKREFEGVGLVDLADGVGLSEIVEGLGLDIDITPLHSDVPFREKKKVQKLVTKKAKQKVKQLLEVRVKRIEEAHSRIMKNRIPQDRWVNFHVLSKSLGGFTNLRDKLLETKGAETPVMQVIVVG